MQYKMNMMMMMVVVVMMIVIQQMPLSSVCVCSYSLQQVVSWARSGVRPTMFPICWCMNPMQSACWAALWHLERMHNRAWLFTVFLRAIICMTCLHIYVCISLMNGIVYHWTSVFSEICTCLWNRCFCYYHVKLYVSILCCTSARRFRCCVNIWMYQLSCVQSIVCCMNCGHRSVDGL